MEGDRWVRRRTADLRLVFRRPSTPVIPGLAAAVVAGLVGMIGCQPASGDGAERSAPPARIVTSDQESGETAQADTRSGQVVIRVAGMEVLAEVADEPAERERGLMFRDSLPENEGMLFVYPQEQTLSFIPKIIAVTATLMLLLPWLVSVITQYARESIARIAEAF